VRKIEIPITILVMVGIVCFVVFLGKDNKKSNEVVEEKEMLGVVKFFSTDYDIDSSINDGEYFIIYNGDFSKKGLIDSEGKMIFDINYYNIKYLNSDYFLLSYDYNKSSIVDKTGKEYLNGNRIAQTEIDGKYYYYTSDIENDNITGMRVYNDSFEEVGYYKDIYSGKGKYLFGKNKLINFITGETYDFDKYILDNSDYWFFVKGNGAYVIDFKNDEFKFVDNFKENNDGSVEFDGKYIKGHRYPEKLELNDDYYLKIDNDTLLNLYDKNDTKIASNIECFEVVDGVYLIQSYYENSFMTQAFFFKDGNYVKVNNEDDRIWYATNIVSKKENEKIEFYNFDGKKLDLQCDDVKTEYDDVNSCKRDGKYYLIDKDNKDITDGYEEIDCYGKTCAVKKDGLYGALYNGEKIIDFLFTKLTPYDNYLIAESPYSFKKQIIILGKENIIDNYAPLNDEYKNVDVEKIINDYSLEDIRSDIESNKEFFQKYANLVNTNPGLIVNVDGKTYDYRKYMFNIFKVIIDNKDKVNENYLFESLKKLYFKISAIERLDTAASFAEHIELGINYASNDDVIYHELMHFVDFSINNSEKDSSVMVCNNVPVGFGAEDRIPNQSCYESGYDDILIEPGAELYSSIYYGNYNINSYGNGLLIYGALSYIFGSDTMEDLFFSANSNRKLYELLTGVGMSKEDFVKFESSASKLFVVGDTPTNADYSFVIKSLIEIYKAKIGPNWYDDYEFKAIISMPYSHLQIDPKIVGNDIASKFDSYYYYSKIFSPFIGKYNATSDYLYINYGGKSYIYFKYLYNQNNHGYVLVEYDFKKGKAIDVKELKKA